MKKVLFCLVVLSVIVLTACNNKDSYIKDFRTFIEKVQKEANNYTEKDWEKADKKFSDFIGTSYEKFSKQMTDREKLTVKELTGRYMGIRLEQGMNEMKKKLKEGGEKLDGLQKGDCL